MSLGAMQYTQEHEDWVNAISWSKSDNRIASASRDGVIKVWDAFTGKNLVTYREHRSGVNDVAWSFKDKYIASAGQDKTVKVHEVALSTEIDGLHKQNKPVRSVTWSPSGYFLASGGDDSLVHLWELTNGNMKRSSLYQNHKKRMGISGTSINAIVWAPPNWSPPNWSQGPGFIASAGDDETVHIWEAFTSKEILRYEEHKSRINALAWSPDGRLIASGGDGGSIRIWEPVEEKGITKDSTANPDKSWISNVLRGSKDLTFRDEKVKLTLDDVTALAWSPDGKSLAAASKKVIYILRHNQGTIRSQSHYTDHNSWIRALAWSPDGQYIASGGDDKRVHVWLANAPRRDPKGD